MDNLKNFTFLNVKLPFAEAVEYIASDKGVVGCVNGEELLMLDENGGIHIRKVTPTFDVLDEVPLTVANVLHDCWFVAVAIKENKGENGVGQ